MSGWGTIQIDIKTGDVATIRFESVVNQNDDTRHGQLYFAINCQEFIKIVDFIPLNDYQTYRFAVSMQIGGEKVQLLQ